MKFVDFFRQFSSELSDENKIALSNYVLSGESSPYVENTNNTNHSSLIYPIDNEVLLDKLNNLDTHYIIPYKPDDVIAYRWEHSSIRFLTSRQVLSHVGYFLLMESNIEDLEEDYDKFMKEVANLLATIKPNVMPLKSLLYRG